MKALIEFYKLKIKYRILKSKTEIKRRILRRKFLKWVRQTKKLNYEKAMLRIRKMRWLLSQQDDTPVRERYLKAVSLLEKSIVEE